MLKRTRLSLIMLFAPEKRTRVIVFSLIIVLHVLVNQVPAYAGIVMPRDDTPRSPSPRTSQRPESAQAGDKEAVGDVIERIIEPGDVIGIVVEGYEEDYNQIAVVRENGKISYISLGEIQAAGLTASQLESEIRGKLQLYISDPRVEVSVWPWESIIKPGNVISIAVEGHEEYDLTASVRQDGKITYMPLGEIQAAGLVASRLEENIARGLQSYISDPKVKVSVKERAPAEEVEEAEIEPEVEPEAEKIKEAELEKKEYLISPGDVIDITVTGDALRVMGGERADYNRTVVVQFNGKISYPPLGEIPAAGFTEAQLSQRLAAKLSSYVNNPQVRAAVKGRTDFAEVEEYLIKPGDAIRITVERREDYSRTVDVQSDGKILYPPLGEIPVTGFTEDELSQEIAAGLSSHIDDPKVKVAVSGEVEKYLIKPGDVINITVKGRSNYNQAAVVQSNGKISYSPLGEIQAAGLAPSQLTDSISLGLSTRIDDPQVRVNIRQFKKVPEEIQRVEVEAPAPPKRFGYDFFTGARNRILRIEEGAREREDGEAVPGPSVVKDAISGFVGPMDMMDANITATVPSKYVLGPGDKVTLHFWSDVVEFQTVTLVVDGKGEVIIPRAGKMVVRGMTLAQFQEAAREMLERVAYKNLKLHATLDKLRSIQIFITGEAFRPGSYAVSAVTTLFNALYMCGGPNDNGSLRDIRLLRNTETKIVDFYRFLMDGDSGQDSSLDAGDTIFISQIGRTATTSGELKRPAVYELKEGENLQELTHLAGGIRPSGFLQRVQIDSVDPSRERIILDVDLSDPDQPNPSIFDGDTVTVFSIPSERMNTVTLEGKIRMPGVYQLKEGMRVSDLIQVAQGPLGEAYMERADLLRLNPDQKTTKLIPINLSKALAGDSGDNISLKQWDKLVVYSKWDVKWIADRVVSVHGAVQRPGSYERSDGMTIGDLLIRAGGVLPSAYPDRASLLRLDERGEMTKSIPVNLRAKSKEQRAKSEEQEALSPMPYALSSMLLEDGDTLLVYTYQEARWEPKREVTIEGAVQNPDVFPRVDGMKVSDLIQKAGGLLPEAYPDRALLLRLDERERITQGFSISPKLALQDDPKNNLELRDGDRVIIYTYEDAVWEPKREVTVAGAVQTPEVFERLDGMRVSDLLRRAGGLLPNAYLERADIKRFLPDHETYVTVPVNLARALSGDEEADVLLEDEDLLTVYTLREAQYKPENIVTIYGAVQRPDVYVKTAGMKLSDLLFTAGGLLPGAHKDAEIARISDDGKPLILTVNVIALIEGDESQDVLLEDEDVVSIRKQREFLDALRTVTIEGEVRYPGSYALERNERLSDLIQRVGGLTDRAYPEASVITRKIDYLVLNEQKKSMQQVKKLLEDLSQQEYQRELARAQLIRRERGIEEGASEATPGVSIPAATMAGTIEGAAEVGAVASIPGQTQAAISGIEEITRPQYMLVTPARKMDSFLPSGRFVVDVEKAINHPGIKDDIILADGDTVMIPAMPATISVSGAVIQPSSLVYIKGKSVKSYIEMVGGYSRDADKDAVYVVKANGMVVRGDKAELSPGDVIVVSTKVMVQKITDRWGQVIGAIKFVVTTAATVITIALILDYAR